MWLVTTACCLVVRLGLGLWLDLVSCWLVVMHTYLYYFQLSLSLSPYTPPREHWQPQTLLNCCSSPFLSSPKWPIMYRVERYTLLSHSRCFVYAHLCRVACVCKLWSLVLVFTVPTGPSKSWTWHFVPKRTWILITVALKSVSAPRYLLCTYEAVHLDVCMCSFSVESDDKW